MTIDVRTADPVAASRVGASRIGWRSAASGWRRAGLLGATYALLAGPLDTFDRSAGLTAVVWPASAVAIAWLWRAPRREWPASLLAIAAVMLGMGRLDALAVGVDAGFALASALAVWFGLELAQRFVNPRGELHTTATFTRFLLLLPGLLSVSFAMVGGALVHAATGTDWLAASRAIFGSYGLAMLVIVPGLLEWSRSHDAYVRPAPWWAIVVPALCASCVMVEAFHIRLPGETEHGLLVLMLVWAAVAGSMRAATLCAFSLIATGTALTLLGSGSYHQTGVAGIRELQIDVAVLSTLVFFIAVALIERRLYEVRLERAYKLESLGLLASGVAHDFNNVLAAVRGHAEYADELLPAESEAKRPLQHVLAAVRSGHAMTEQMLLAVGRGPTRRTEAVSMPAVIDEAVALATVDHSKTISIHVRIDERLAGASGWVVAGDRAQLVRVLLNLLRNAVQAARTTVELRLGLGAPPLGEPGIGVVPDEPVLWFEVCDDGPGIAPKLGERIFEPFFSTKHDGNGYGLGLSIAAGIIADHKGGVVCVPGPLGGASFTVLLPAHRHAAAAAPGATDDDGAATASPAAAGVCDGSDGYGGLALLVDDDASLLELLEERVAELGFEPVSHASARAALAALSDEPEAFALLISDVETGELRGDELVAAARRHAPGLPALLTSGAAHAERVARAAGIPFLPKPFTHAELVRAVAALQSTSHGPC